MNKKHVLFTIILICIFSFNSHSQVIKAGAYKLYYTEFKNNTENEEFFYLKIDKDHFFEIVTPYVLNELSLVDSTKPQDIFKGKVEVDNETITFNFSDDGEFPDSTPYFGPPKLEIKISKKINTAAEYSVGTISVMCVIRPFYFRFEAINDMPLQIGLEYSTTTLLNEYVEFDSELSRRIKKDKAVTDELYDTIIGNSYKIDIDKHDSYWFTIIFYDKKDAEIFFETKEDGIIQSTGKCTYYVYYNHDNVLELAFRHCLPTEWGYYILTEPTFANQEINTATYYIYFGGNIPRSEMGTGK